MGIDDRTKPIAIKIVNVSTGAEKEFTIWKGIPANTYFYGVGLGPAIDTIIFARSDGISPIMPLMDNPEYQWYAEMIDAIYYKNFQYQYKLKSYDSYNKEYLYKILYMEVPGASDWHKFSGEVLA